MADSTPAAAPAPAATGPKLGKSGKKVRGSPPSADISEVNAGRRVRGSDRLRVAPRARRDGVARAVVIVRANATRPLRALRAQICCSCPETRKIRDECIREKGEDACKPFIEAHKACLRLEGFDV